MIDEIEIVDAQWYRPDDAPDDPAGHEHRPHPHRPLARAVRGGVALQSALEAPAALEHPEAVAAARPIGIRGLVAAVARPHRHRAAGHLRPAGLVVGERVARGRGREHVRRRRRAAAEIVERHPGRRGQVDLAAVAPVEHLPGGEPLVLVDLAAVDHHLAVARAGDEEPRGEPARA